MIRNYETFWGLRIFPRSGFFHVGKESIRERNEFSFLLDSLFWFFLILGGKKRRLENFFFQIFIRIIWWNIGILYYTTNQTTKENITFFFPPSKTWCESCKGGFFYFGNDLRANGLIIIYLLNQFYCQGILCSNFVLALLLYILKARPYNI